MLTPVLHLEFRSPARASLLIVDVVAGVMFSLALCGAPKGRVDSNLRVLPHTYIIVHDKQ